jgi:hypothetical protein
MFTEAQLWHTLPRITAVAIFFVLALANAATATGSYPLPFTPQQFNPSAGGGSSDDTTYVQAAIDAAAAANAAVHLPCGTYLINSATLTLPSMIKIYGDGPCAIVKMGSGISANANISSLNPPGGGQSSTLFSNANWTGGNSGIVIRDLGFDLTSAPRNAMATFFYNVTGLRVDTVTVLGNAPTSLLSADGIDCVHCTDVDIGGSTVTGTANSCFGVWGGSTDVIIRDNHCIGSSALPVYGISVTGANTDLSPATFSDLTIEGNEIVGVGTGVWVQGGWNHLSGGGATLGLMQNVAIIGNIIRNSTGFHSIKVSDSKRISIIGNQLDTSQENAINVQSEYPADGSESDLTVIGNVINGCNAAAGANACINMIGAAGGVIASNRIVGTAQNYGITIDSTSSDLNVFDNSMPTGTPGRISNASSSTVVSDANIDSWSLYGELSIQNGDFAAFWDASNTNYFDVFNSSDSLCIQYNSGGCLVSLGQTGGITTSGTAPTCTVTGAGSGASCTTATGSNDLSGKMIITAGSGPGYMGNIQLFQNAVHGAHSPGCVVQGATGTSSWNSQLGLVDVSENQSLAMTEWYWFNNGIVLTNGDTYLLAYHCFGY